ncbi:MAG: hypothetical protein ACI8R4_003633, partial [Paracoccaceae bacterium]
MSISGHILRGGGRRLILYENRLCPPKPPSFRLPEDGFPPVTQ